MIKAPATVALRRIGPSINILVVDESHTRWKYASFISLLALLLFTTLIAIDRHIMPLQSQCYTAALSYFPSHESASSHQSPCA